MTSRTAGWRRRTAGFPRIPVTAVRAVLLIAVLGLLGGAFVLLGNAYAPASPEPLARRPIPVEPVVDPARPCTREAPPVPAAEPGTPSRAGVSFDPASNTIVLASGEGVSLSALSSAVGNPAALREVAPGEWLLGADLQVLTGASLQITAPDVRWLKLGSSPAGFVTVKVLGGALDITGTCVTSWDTAAGHADADSLDGRAFLLARDGARMLIQHSEVRYLGYGEVESYGMSWRTAATGGITTSVVSHLFYGLYSFRVDGLTVQDNEFHHNELYGIDPHTSSRRMLIERNIVHNNGKHGIVLAEDCTDSVIRDNVVYANDHHGIVLYLHSDRNIVEGNDSFGNAAQGININESAGNTVRGNRVYDNTESGIAVGQTAKDNVVENNQIRGNQQDGIRLVSDAVETTVRGNVIGENTRYGVYVDGNGTFDLAGNTIFGNRTGVMLKGTPTVVTPADNRLFDNVKGDIAKS
ncbi:right-handed parallel beta-helix repeat-containing protein [Pseudonocardia xinjiangensis]|uniref:right-handed parallel beta-helix repeat-containing protein n=1 Tax=Pseudonocardia xinjiangensis TaxID=75289 RepID=UPI003D8C3B96